MKFKIIKLAGFAKKQDPYIFKRLMALAKDIHKMDVRPKARSGLESRRKYLRIDMDVMRGLIDPDSVAYKDEIGRVEVEDE